MATRFRLKELLDAEDSPVTGEPGKRQSELARRSGVSVVTINAMANNRTTRVDLSTLDAISKVLGCEPGDLIEREPGKRRSK